MSLADSLTAPDPLLDRLSAEARRVETVGKDGKRVVWRIWGPGPDQAPGLIFLHGGSGSWRHWVRNIGAFTDRRTVLVPDLPGYGESDVPDYPADLEVMGALLAAGIDEILGEAARYDLVAFSYGGSMCSQLLRQMPGRQRTITLSSVAGLGETRVPRMVSVRGKEGAELVEAHRTNLLALMLSGPEAVDALALRVQHESTRLARIRPMSVRRGAPLRETLVGITAPVAAIWGTKDNFMYEGAMEDRLNTLRRVQPDAVVRLVEGAGHWLAYERSDIFNAFLSENLARGG